jgi:hypothetical protein
MALRRSATALLECDKNFRRNMGHRDRWILEQNLMMLAEVHGLALRVRAVVVMRRLTFNRARDNARMG